MKIWIETLVINLKLQLFPYAKIILFGIYS